MADYSTMSLEELQAANQELMDKRAAVEREIKDEQLALHAELDKRIAEERLSAQFGELSDDDKVILGQMLGGE